MISAVIIEDELNSQELMRTILKEYCENVKVLGVADGVESGIALIKRTEPEVIFLDIEINGGTGFDLLKAFENPTFKIIFVTGYNHYAIKAIKHSALDYILKPINLEEIQAAIKKVRLELVDQKAKISFLRENLNKGPEELDQFVISDSKGHNVVRFEEILYLEADRSYITFVLGNNKKHISTNPLNFYETILPESLFYRIHKSYLINIKKVLKVHTGRGGLVELVGGYQLPIAYRRKSTFLKLLKNEG